MDLNYDSCAQFLARLDADAENASLDDLDSLQSPSSYDDARNSLSPPGLSSGSVTSHSPESIRLDWDPDTAFFPDFSDDQVGILQNDNGWVDNTIMPPTTQGLDSMNDYIKIENHPSPYDQQQAPSSGTIAPDSTLRDPTAPSAVEGRGFMPFPSDRAADAVFDFNGYSTNPNQARRQNSGEYQQFGWAPQPTDQRNPYAAAWQQQQQQPASQQSPQQLQPHLRSPVQVTSPVRNSQSPSASHSSPDSRADSHSDDGAPAPRSKKRKTSTDESPAEPAQNGRKQPKKTAHNMIEKRYRTNLNDKIAALRDSVPSLRIMAGTSKMGEDDEEEDLEGLAPAHKLNKATVLAKATEYIRHLEKRNKRLIDENEQLKNRLNAFEKLAMGGGMNPQLQHPGQMGHRGQPTGGPGGGLMSRLMVGSLAGLMVMNGLHSNSDDDTKQLFALPTFAFQFIGAAGPSRTNELIWLLVKLMLIIGAVVYVITPGFFDRRRPSADAKPTASTSQNVPRNAPSPSSPLEDRTHAWLTAIQTVWVPRHSITLELAALGLKFSKLTLRRLIGWERYSMLTGLTHEEEQARIKSWTIALDAQLTGGDASINHSRLLLTLLASWTTPATPARLMLNALHIRVLFYDFGNSFQGFAERLSNHYWAEAKKAQRQLAAEIKDSKDNTSLAADLLPDNLAFLLDLDATDVFDPLNVQKAHDLAYNRNTSDIAGIDEGFDNVVKDPAIRSPLDALAAWYSSLVLQGVFVASLKAKTSKSLATGIQSDLNIALRAAPPASAAHLRALAANAVLAEENPEQHILTALNLFQDEFNATSETAKTTTTNTAVTTTADIRIALRCAMALALMKKGSNTEAIRLFSDLDWRRPTDMGILGFVSAWKMMTTFVKSEEGDEWVNSASEAVYSAAGKLRVWIGDKKVPKVGVEKKDCKKIIDFCNGLQAKLAGMERIQGLGDGEKDDGYCSGSSGKEIHVLQAHAER